MDTINTTTPPLITNTLSGGTFHFLTTRLEPSESEFFRGFKIDDDIVLFFEEQVVAGSGDIVISSETDTRHINIEDTSQVSFDTQRIFSSIFGRSSELRTEYLEFGALIINPETDLLPDTAYTIQLNDGALVDTAGDALAGFNDIAVSAVESIPNLLRVIPSVGSTDFRADENLFLSFDETVVAGSGEVVIRSDTDTRIIDINDTSQVTFEDNGTAIINPQEDLIPKNVYTLQVSDGAVVDIEGNAFTDFNPRTFVPVAGSLPKLEFSNPENGSSEFQVNDNIELRFDEAVKAGTGNIVISSDSDVRTIAINDTSQVSFNSSVRFGTVIIDPTDDLMPDVTYTVQIARGVITDQSGNAYSGFDNGSISTVEIPPFSFFGTIRDGERSIFKTDENIVSFIANKVIAGSGDITISNGSDIRTIAIDDTSQVTFETTEGVGVYVTIDPKEDLIPDTTYTVQIPSSAIIDTEGGIFAGINEAFLTTIDPGPNFIRVPHNFFETFKADNDFVLTFDEPVIAGEGDIVISNGIDVRTIAIDDASQVTFLGRSVVIDPNDDLVPGQYTGSITSGAITDRAGNTFAGFNDAPFTVVNDAAPLLTGSNPKNGDTDFGVSENIKLIFDETVAAGSGNILISNGTDTRIIPIDDTSQVTFEEPNISDQFASTFGTAAAVVIINPTEDLVPGTTYTAEMVPGVVTDTDGNPYAGFSGSSFATIDSMLIIAGGG